MEKQMFYECGICECLHRMGFNGDCRDDKERLEIDEIPSDAEIITWEEMLNGFVI